MAKSTIDPAVLAKVRADLRASADLLLSDRVIALERAIDVILQSLEATT